MTMNKEAKKILAKGILAMLALSAAAGFIQGLIWKLLWTVINHSEKNL